MDILDNASNLLQSFKVFLSDLFAFVWLFVFYVYNIRQTKKVVPPTNNPILLKSAKTLAEEIRSKKVSSRQVVQAFVERLEQVNPILNACAQKYCESALKKADEIDEFISRASAEDLEKIAAEKPLLGVPFTCKDMCEIEGTITTFGAWSMRENVSKKTDGMTNVYINAGAIPLAKSTVPELCMWMGSENAIHGRTNNPYDSRRNAGGSSGGEGALLGAAASVIGLGSDIGGSIRIPAAFNGVYGLKTSPGVFPSEGGFGNPAEKLFGVFGPLGRYVEDFEVILKSNKASTALPSSEFIVDEILIPGQYNIPWVPRITTEQAEASQKVADFLVKTYDASLGSVDLNPVRKDFMNNFLAVYNEFPIKQKNPAGTMKGLFYSADGKFATLTEFPKKLFGRSHHTWASIIQVTQLDCTYTDEQLDMYSERLHSLRKRYDKLLGNSKLIIQPGWPNVANYHYGDLAHMNFAYTGVFNYLGLPSIVCPVGLNDEGVPLAVSITGPRFSDLHLIEVAKKVHEKFGGWQQAPAN